MANKPNTTNQEVLFGYRLIRYLHGNINNIYLLLAVIAWLRSESGQHYIGNNPLNLRPGSDDAKYRSGVRKTKGNGYFSMYKSIDAGARATANRLLRAGHDYRGYGAMMDAIQRSDTPEGKQTADEAKQEQAVDFMWALILSKWDAGHYGLKGDQLKDPKAIYGTTLYKVFYSLTGHPVNIPADAEPPPKTYPQPKQPRQLTHITPVREYLSPTEARSFYEARNKPIPPMPGGR